MCLSLRKARTYTKEEGFKLYEAEKIKKVKKKISTFETQPDVDRN